MSNCGPILTTATTVWRSELLSSLPGVTHAVTRRVPGLGKADGNVGYSAPRDRADAWAMRQHWSSAAGLDAEDLVTLGQVHGADVHPVSARDAGRGARPGSSQIGLGDALVAGEPGPVLMTLHADCQPILFVAPATRRRSAVVAVAHAGWRGTVAGIAAITLRCMEATFSVQPGDVRIALGPAIGSCCYDVGGEVVDAWRQAAGEESEIGLIRANGAIRFSLAAANRLLLIRAGVKEEHIEVSSECTRCNGDSWFSHRGQGPNTGRFGAMIAITV